MKINRTNCQPRGRHLKNVSPGSTVSFCKQFHQDHCLGDIFLVVNDNGYLDRHYAGQKKVVIINIESGKMSVVSDYRECYIVKGEFCADSNNRY